MGGDDVCHERDEAAHLCKRDIAYNNARHPLSRDHSFLKLSLVLTYLELSQY